MKILEQLIHLQQLYLIIIAGGAVCGIALIFIIRFLIRRSRFVSVFNKIIQEELDDFPEPMRDMKSRKTKLIVKLLKAIEADRARHVLYRTGLAHEWVDVLKITPMKKYYMNILHFHIQEGFFFCFKYALEKNKWRKHLKQWLEDNRSQLPLQTIAHSGRGESFDGKKAFTLFEEKKEEVQEMLGDPDWKGRFFALKILVAAEDDETRTLLFNLFNDPNPLIRKTMIEEYDLHGQEKVKDSLFHLILKDPNPGIRAAALEKYRKSFGNLPEINIETLTQQEIIHLLEALRPQVKDDEGIATGLMLDDNSEIRYHAARYLDKSGTLVRFCTNLDMGDMKDFKRKITILKNAANVGITGFLKKCIYTGSRESLTLAAEVLNVTGDTALLGNLLKMAIDHSLDDVYRLTVHAIVNRGDADTRYLLCDELHNNIQKKEILTPLIKEITPLEDTFFIDPLIEILGARDDLTVLTRKALLTKQNDTLIEKLIGIIKNETSAEKNQLRIQALFLLAELKKEYCLSFIFEHLAVLPIEFVSQFADIVIKYPKRLLKETIAYYLKQVDGEIRAHLIALIPKIDIPDFIGEVRTAQDDADPLVRIASTFALVEMNDTRSFGQAFSLMRDPVEEVRNQVAFALGGTGKKEIFKHMAKIFYDENEVSSVKESIIRGIAESKTPQATDLLVDFLEKDKTFTGKILDELKSHTQRRNIEVLINRMKDGGESLKKNIANAFIKMGMEVKPDLISLLESELTSHKVYASEILDTIGATEEEITKLKHRDPVIRREAARILSLIATVKSFRGLIMASRDPDREVRINVVRALEKLETPEGKTVLKALEEDPDSKIRKYTHWALERLKAKELV